ncbi:hypothetical protein [Paenibacillus medicaginis]|uniref:Uncharacterized protein n=1 Tax=Paenibacillus medicaginis TaxID=1470560 RepID=A0ABV5C0Z3_9BACL
MNNENVVVLLEYVDAAWLSRQLGVTKQSVGKSAKSALKDGYRGSFPRPDATVEGRPLWLKSRFGEEQ